jgi:hypothetical protein
MPQCSKWEEPIEQSITEIFICLALFLSAHLSSISNVAGFLK